MQEKRPSNNEQKVILGNTQIWFDAEWVTTEPERCFDIDFWQQEGAVIGSAQGRGTTWFVQFEKFAVALRHYIRGGLFRKLVKDKYLFTGWEQTRAVKEFRLLSLMKAAGLPVPRPIAARVIRNGLFYRADLVVEKINDAKDLVAVLQRSELSDDVYQEIGKLVRRMHDMNICHTDLNIHNILLDGHGALWLIDFDKCGQKAGDNWKSDNLARLKRSFLKEQNRFGIHWQEDNWLQLLKGYGN
ncbi:3-deoxy-D-manno-octulosonic acid kinase [Veronia nyctiphanis]|uniref:3-deoxy-D-manno-octulosonic acid kinase n=1 Tax=Veronia nyctiphanis TaxID=1278244 RepID=A0A4Q0YR00_9GAMM|nr:3-deoxy-D-manno-octulosonic acid kinase [Veronia nyctiphanis]RXJ73502.1 3-deoxy-D-manno-octulosonic acid kinase [Veronia nyctiphanis]